MIRFATALVVLAVTALVAFLAASAFPLVASGEVAAVLLGPWRPAGAPAAFGIAPMIVATLWLSVMATALATPMAIGVCAFAQGVGPRPLARLAMAAVHLMTGIPTVLYGFVSVFLLVPMLRQAGAGGFSLLAAGITLAALVFPTIAITLQGRLEAAGPGLRLTCAAVGMQPAAAFRRVLLPACGPGVAAAVLLGFCRASGDTVVALMVGGNAAVMPGSALDSVRTLTAHIGLVLATDWSSPEFRSIGAAGLLLFVLNAVLTAVVRRVGPTESSRAPAPRR